MQRRFTPEPVIYDPVLLKEEEFISDQLPDVKKPSENMVQRLLNYSRSIEVTKTKSVGVITTTLS